MPREKRESTRKKPQCQSENVSGVQLSRLTMLPIAEWHRGLFMESLSVMARSRKRRKVKLSRK